MIKNIINNLMINSDRKILHFPEFKKSYSGKEIYNLVNAQYGVLKNENINLIVLQLDNSIDFITYFLASLFLNLEILILNPIESAEKKENYVSYFLIKSVKDIKIVDAKSSVSFTEDEINYLGNITEPITARVYMPTSSTTGASKIVPHSIDMILANVDSVVNHHDLNRNSVIMTCLPMFHVNALYFSFLSVFLVGGELVLHKMYDIRGMINSIEHYKVSIFSLIPSVVANITRNFDLLNVKNLNNLKYIVSAAAPLSKDLLINFYKLTSKQIIQGYGLSEAINFSCITPRDLSQDEYLYIMTNFKVPTIGIALKCNTIDIIKENNELASEGEVGEFYIGGKNVFDGYLNDEKILRKKDNKIPTGDLGFWRMFKNEKYFFVTSRKKEVAKINGESVSLRDLDEHYCNDLEIDSYTITFKNKYLGEAIGAVAVNNLSELDVKKLISHLMLKNGDRPNSQRVKALILVSKESFRTVSGKAKRWSFESKCLPLESVVLDDRIKVLI